MTSPSVHSEVDTRVLDTRGLSRRAKEALSRRGDSEFPSDPLGPARGIVLSGIAGLLLWITLTVVGYLLVEGAWL